MSEDILVKYIRYISRHNIDDTIVTNDNTIKMRDRDRLGAVSPRAKRKSKAKSIKKGKGTHASKK